MAYVELRLPHGPSGRHQPALFSDAQPKLHTVHASSANLIASPIWMGPAMTNELMEQGTIRLRCRAVTEDAPE